MLSKLRRKAFLAITVLFLLCIGGSSMVVRGQEERSLGGKWTGVLDAGGVRLHLVFNISRNDDGSYAATLDSPDQGARGIPVTSVSLSEGRVSLQVAAVAGGYEGTVSDDGLSIDGNWSQGGSSFPVMLKLQADEDSKTESSPVSEVVSPEDVQRLSGKWFGNLTIPGSGITVRLVLNISATKDNRLTATIDSPDQNAKDIPVSKIEVMDDHINVEAGGIRAVFEGDISGREQMIEGKWEQGGSSLPLSLKRVDQVPEPQRPQEPKPPYPYRSEEVVYPNSKADITLAGTLTMPEGEGPFPAVLLISGSGAQDRDETLLGHKPFLVLADHLTRNGIAVLRFDDRGTGKSAGNFSTATTVDFATDVEAGIAYLGTRPEIDQQHIGLIGHSEGGLIAPMAAVQTSDVAFVVLMAAPGIPSDELLLRQQGLIAKANGASEAAIKASQQLNANLFDILKQEPDNEKAKSRMRSEADKFWNSLDDKVKEELKKNGADQLKDAALAQLTSPWFRYFITFQPTEWLEQVKCPVLAINGEKDLQVPAQVDLDGISTALKKGGNEHFTVKELPGLNHLFQTAETGAPSEYSKIEETMSPKALNFISDWILATVK